MSYHECADEREIRHRMEVASLHEEIDRLLAALKLQSERCEKMAAMRDQISRLTLALDEALGMIRARNEIIRQEREAEL